MVFFTLTRKYFYGIVLNVGMKYISRTIILYLVDILSQNILMLKLLYCFANKSSLVTDEKGHVALSYTK